MLANNSKNEIHSILIEMNRIFIDGIGAKIFCQFSYLILRRD